jgi:hypothetical protein
VHHRTVQYHEGKALLDLAYNGARAVAQAVGWRKMIEHPSRARHGVLGGGFSGSGAALQHEAGRLWWRDQIEVDVPNCNARTRAGGKCKMRPVAGRERCRLHGGLSTGPKTQEGRERIVEAQRRRWEAYASQKVDARVD